MKKTVIFIVLFFVISGVAVASKQDVVAVKLIKHSNFKEIHTNVFVSPETTEKEREELLHLLTNAKKRIQNTFGAYTSNPIIISSHNIENRKKYSTNGYASTKLLPFSNNEAFVVIGENGHNLDIISHELLHAEVFHRVGYLNQIFKIPVWFNEGVAMQVDFREKYTAISVEKNDIKKLTYGWQFFKGNREKIIQNYSLAKIEVRNWLGNHKKDKLYNFLTNLKSGHSFDAIYDGN